ncbi:MAG: hypothetical protein K9M02_13395 [Thiohalocapsa sp.]|nr:hypothetical protein [Thiohalocapsa sp.]
MPRTKNEVLTIRTTTEVKALPTLAAEREPRSAASMVEVPGQDYATPWPCRPAAPRAQGRPQGPMSTPRQ